MKSVLKAVAVLAMTGGSALAQTVWTMPTEYPATAMPGQGIATFAAEVEKRVPDVLTIKPSFGGEAGIKSAGMLAAIGEGKVQAGDAFGGALRSIDPIFGLSSLPFVATSIDGAHKLADDARSAYDAAFRKQGVRLLYMTPWPASGIWAKAPLGSLSDLKSLAMRTYDDTSTEVMKSAGVNATKLSWADAIPRLRSGDANAVLSSGDGGAGRKLWEILPSFSELNYAIPLSFATVSLKAYEALPAEVQQAVDEAAKATEARQWQAMLTRVDENYDRMRKNGVQVQTEIPTEIVISMKTDASWVIEKWKTQSPDGARLLDGMK